GPRRWVVARVGQQLPPGRAEPSVGLIAADICRREPEHQSAGDAAIERAEQVDGPAPRPEREVAGVIRVIIGYCLPPTDPRIGRECPGSVPSTLENKLTADPGCGSAPVLQAGGPDVPPHRIGCRRAVDR